MLSSSINSICTNLSPILQIVGYLILIFKILLPLILIIIVSLDLTKAVVSNKSEDTKKYLKSSALKLALCVLIYFVPMITMLLMSFVGQYEAIKNKSGLDYDICYDCMYNPTSEKCNDAVERADFQ